MSGPTAVRKPELLLRLPWQPWMVNLWVVEAHLHSSSCQSWDKPTPTWATGHTWFKHSASNYHPRSRRQPAASAGRCTRMSFHTAAVICQAGRLPSFTRRPHFVCENSNAFAHSPGTRHVHSPKTHLMPSLSARHRLWKAGGAPAALRRALALQGLGRSPGLGAAVPPPPLLL